VVLVVLVEVPPPEGVEVAVEVPMPVELAVLVVMNVSSGDIPMLPFALDIALK
jgi:hypothetical protein